MDFANDDDFETSWLSNATVKNPWYEVTLGGETSFNMITIYEPKACITGYRLEYRTKGVWKPLLSGSVAGKVKIHRFTQVKGDAVRMLIDGSTAQVAVGEVGVFREK
jgi:alpha-L-fucosidase